MWSTERKRLDFQAVQLDHNDFIVSRGKQIRMKNKKSIQADVPKKQQCVALADGVVAS